MTQKTRVTYRPTEATALIENGIPCRIIPNVFDRKKSAWEYPDTPASRKVLEELRAEREGAQQGVSVSRCR